MRCPKCGKEIANDSVFCEYCGEKVVPVAAKKKVPLWLIIVGALIVVALIVIFCYDSSPESQPLPDEVTPVEEVTDSTSGESIVHGLDSLDAVARHPAESKQVAEDDAAKQAKIEADKKAQEEAEKKAKADAEKAKKEQSAREQAQQAEVEDVSIKPQRKVPSGYVDLGLKSGTLWKENNESGFYTYDEAMARFGKKLPTLQQWEELENKCKWKRNGSRYRVTGPNGNSITLPAAGSHDCLGAVAYVGQFGSYWSSTPDNSELIWYLATSPNGVGMLSTPGCNGHSVRLVQ